MKQTIALFTLVFICMTAFAQNTEKQEQQKLKEPYYMIEFRAINCKFEILINKVSLLMMNINGQIGSEMPCNYLILESGEQQLDIIVQPCTGESGFVESSEFSAKVNLYDVSNGFTLMEEDIVACEMSDADKTEASYKNTAYFNAEVPYQQTAWRNSIDLNTVENLREKLEAAYKKIGDMIIQKQYDAFRNSMQEQESRMAVSMYLDEEESKKRMDELIEDFQGGFELLPLSSTKTMHLYANGKLACLRAEDGESVLQLYNKETEEEMTLDIMFHLKEGDTELSVAP